MEELTHFILHPHNEGIDGVNIATKPVSVIVKNTQGSPVTKEEIDAAASERSGYDFLGWFNEREGGKRITEIPSLTKTMTLYAHWREKEAPTGIIHAAGKQYDTVGGDETGVVYTRDASVEIEAADTAGTVTNSGVKSVQYYISDTSVDEAQFDTLVWEDYTEEFELPADGRYVIYARIEDHAGNVTYCATNSIVLDTKEPTYAGIKDGQKSCESVWINVADANLNTFLVNGQDVTDQIVGGKYQVTADKNVAASVGQEMQIVITDKAGNVTRLSVTLYNGHDFADAPTIRWSDDLSSATADFVCAHDETHTITKDCTVVKKTEGDKVIYVAEVEMEGKTFDDTIQKPIPTTEGQPKEADVVTTQADTQTGGNTDAAKTGDETPVVWLFILLMLSGSGLAVLYGKRRKK